MQETNTEYLYHYTTIEKLALILKNRTIRLNPLDKMDDLQEQKTADVKGMGKFVFVSCWTSDEVETIPMWKMYTQPTAGVRIKMRKRPFVSYDFSDNKLKAHISRSDSKEHKEELPDKIYCDYQPLCDANLATAHFYGEDILFKVKYSKEKSELEPNVLTWKHDGKFNLCLTSLGKNKNEYWDFQNESRYILHIFPFAYSPDIKNKELYNSIQFSLLIDGKLPPPFRYIDLRIEDKYFSEMEITISPQMSPGNRVLLETLVEKYNPNATIKDSELLGMI